MHWRHWYRWSVATHFCQLDYLRLSSHLDVLCDCFEKIVRQLQTMWISCTNKKCAASAHQHHHDMPFRRERMHVKGRAFRNTRLLSRETNKSPVKQSNGTIGAQLVAIDLNAIFPFCRCWQKLFRVNREIKREQSASTKMIYCCCQSWRKRIIRICIKSNDSNCWRCSNIFQAERIICNAILISLYSNN